MKRVISNIVKNEVLLGVFIIILFFILRLLNLTVLPVFCDEAIYIRWSQIMKSEPTLRFLPLSDGKQPLFMWLTIPFLKLFSDPLFAGRFVSILAGFGSLLGIFFLSWSLFTNKKVALFSSLIYAVLPYSVFFDRMALVDSLLNCLGIWTLLLSVLLIKYQRTDLAMVGGMILGAALITKSPALFFALLFPLSLVLVSFKKLNLISLGKIFGLWFIVYFFAFLIYNSLRLGPNFQMIALRNKDYVFTLKEIFSHPLDPLRPHLNDVIEWFPNLFTLPILLASVGGLVLGMRAKRKESLVLFLWFLVPLITQVLIAKVFNSRYLFFTIFPLIVFAGLFLDNLFTKIKKGWLRVLVFLVFFILALRYDFLLLTDPAKAPLTEEMKSGYLRDWTSGYGIPQVRDFIKKEAEKNKIVVGTEGFFGTLPDGLQIYFDKNPKVTIIGVGLEFQEIPNSLKEAALTTPTYLVVNQSRLRINNNPHLKLIFKIPKVASPKGQDYLLLFKVE